MITLAHGSGRGNRASDQLHSGAPNSTKFRGVAEGQPNSGVARGQGEAAPGRRPEGGAKIQPDI